ncbi:hypothetical protein NPX13_g832 [Xylaria arbuscula]|uniref:Uncharacterized protein n=1 Tax=Xylaria arbuscula TaxID=114810 RepID=A0A9W8TS94_9PEZI|nr:hypothetical protein NPX13_g832 [Xylaria arbuscula]
MKAYKTVKAASAGADVISQHYSFLLPSFEEEQRRRLAASLVPVGWTARYCAHVTVSPGAGTAQYVVSGTATVPTGGAEGRAVSRPSLAPALQRLLYWVIPVLVLQWCAECSAVVLSAAPSPL